MNKHTGTDVCSSMYTVTERRKLQLNTDNWIYDNWI